MAEKLNIMFGSWKTYICNKKETLRVFYIWKVFLNFVKNWEIEDALDVWSYGL